MRNSRPGVSHLEYRPDIDGLRALAVLSVVTFHAFPGWIRGGYIGVDVFFVISGFLISGILFEHLASGIFSFSGFYARRVRRIFPALLLVLLACLAFGWFWLLSDEYAQLGKHIAAGAGFASNLVLWSEAGYFDNSAETKPLLHLWSLGIEEQFYLVWPLLLWLTWKLRLNLLTLTVLVALGSYYLSIQGIEHDAAATFYSPLTRFGELLSGAFLARIELHRKASHAAATLKLDDWFSRVIYEHPGEADGTTLANVASALGLLLLAYGVWRMDGEIGCPGKWALVPVLGAALIISAGQKAWINRVLLSNRIAVWIGLISYPLYL
jgi:peptidoglycan/LPS O-acetylase OafA/YrhL